MYILNTIITVEFDNRIKSTDDQVLNINAQNWNSILSLFEVLTYQIFWHAFRDCWHQKQYFLEREKKCREIVTYFFDFNSFFCWTSHFHYLAFSVLRFLIAKQTYNILIGINSVCNWIQKFILLKNLHTTIKEWLL